jgi:hypothetical protein
LKANHEIVFDNYSVSGEPSIQEHVECGAELEEPDSRYGLLRFKSFEECSGRFQIQRSSPMDLSLIPGNDEAELLSSPSCEAFEPC